MTTSELRLNREIILAQKRKLLEERQSKTPLEAVRAMAAMQRRPRPILTTMMDSRSRVQVIGQITRMETYDPVSSALRFVREGADAVAFFTDNASYEHDLDDLLMVAMGIKDKPVIYQNYLVNEYNVIEARASDASAVVLYASALTPSELRRVVSITQRWKMSVIIQVNNEEDLLHAATLCPHAIGIGHSESLDTERSLQKVSHLRSMMPHNVRMLMMNCLQNLDEVEAAVRLGVHAVVINEEVMNTRRKSSRLKDILERR